MSKFTFEQATEFLTQGSISLGIERTFLALKHFAVPPFVHVVGTNGKGSTSEMIANALLCSGKRVGVFSSPHLENVRECIRINGEWVSESLLCDACERVRGLNLSLTAFERLLCVAICCFHGVDICVIEAGMGGGKDATNALPSPLCVVLTSVCLDHVEYLGGTVLDIAREKLAVADKPCVPIVCATQDALVEELARERGAIIAGLYQGEIGMQGAHQRVNAGSAAECLRVLGVGESFISQGIASARLQGRLESLSGVYLDGAHNEGAAATLAQFFAKGAVFVCGIFKDKRVKEFCAALSPCAKKVFCVTPPSSRGLEAEALSKTFSDMGVLAECLSLENAITAALVEGERLGLPVCVCGSLSLIAPARKVLCGKKEALL